MDLTIIDDDLLETDEEFQITLQLKDTRNHHRVFLQPDTANITIEDDDSMNKSYVLRKKLIS